MQHNFIDISDFSKKKLRDILTLASKIKKNPNKYANLLKGKSLGLLFEKESTRTRLSFSIGMSKLGGNVIELSSQSIGFGTRESESDVLMALSQYIDCLMIRNNDHNKLKNLASLSILPLINGLSDHSHPCQILSDIFTIEEKIGSIEKKTICWIGDFNNVLISLIEASLIFKFKLNIVIPKSIEESNKKTIKKIKSKNIIFYNDIRKGSKNVDCIMTDVWISMGEKNSSIKKKLFKNFKIDNKIIKNAKSSVIFMHCLPAHRGEEVSNSVIDGNQSVVWNQAKNRMYVQQAILSSLIG